MTATVTTTCMLDCPDRCSILCRVDGAEVGLRGDPEHPYTRGFTCAKIRRYPARLRSPHRIREPWVRAGDSLRPTSWDAAMARVAAALEAARRADPAAILHVRGSGSAGVSKRFADYLFHALGARATQGSLCDAAGSSAVEADVGALAMNHPDQLDRARAVVLWGKHPRACSVHTAAQLVRARARGVPVVAVNPDGSALRSLADRVIRIRPGSDRFLALACSKLYLGGTSRPPPWTAAAGADDYRRLLGSWDLGELLAACDVSREDADHLAGLYLETPQVATVAGWGLQRYRHGGATVRAIHALCFLAGTLDCEGGGLYYGVASSRHFRPPTPPGGGGAPPLLLPRLARQLPSCRPPVKVAWFTASNLLNQAPDSKALVEAFRAVETVVAVDGFWTETARHADVVLPCRLWLEEEDVAGSYWHDGLGLARQVVAPPAGCRGDFEILSELGERLGLELPFRAREEWLTACLPRHGPSLEELRRTTWHLAGEPQLAWQGGFAHPDRKFHLLTTVAPPEPEAAGHPLRLLSLIRQEALHSQMLPEEQLGPLELRLHPTTAQRFGLEPGAPARLVSAVGELEGQVRIDPDLHPDAVACPRGGWVNLGLGANALTTDAVSDLGDCAALYDSRVRLETAAGRGGR